jgi:hypothetical protein
MDSDLQLKPEGVIPEYGRLRLPCLLVLLPLLGMSVTACNFGHPPAPQSAPEIAPSSPAVTSADHPGGTVYYVRQDGGDSSRCSGLADAPDPGSGANQPCAWDHPFRALPPGGSPVLAGGDTLMIGAGSYRMGYGAAGTENCEAEAAFDCRMPPIPSGPDESHPTSILGAGWYQGCPAPPQLWGSERPWSIIDLSGSSHVAINCLEITDHASCVEGHSGGMGCERDNPPFGDWAPIGLHAEDSTDVHLANLNIHGMAAAGIHAGRLRDWSLDHVRLAGNGLAGWDGDLWDDLGDADSGSMQFRNWTVEWNGCAESYPGGQPVGCWAQDAGGYGDGVGTGETGGDWIIEDSSFLYNTSDGLDLLYHTLGGKIVLNRVRAAGNAGNQIKLAGASDVANSLIVGNCAFFESQPFTFQVDPCRAGGNALAIFYTGGEHVSLTNSTVYGQGDGLVLGGVRPGSSCNGSESLVVRNSMLIGDTDYFDPSDVTFAFYQEDCGRLRMDSDFNLISRTKDFECGADGALFSSGMHDHCSDLQLAAVLPELAQGIPVSLHNQVVDAGDNAVCPPDDLEGNMRPQDGDHDGTAICDLGAYELHP